MVKKSYRWCKTCGCDEGDHARIDGTPWCYGCETAIVDEADSTDAMHPGYGVDEQPGHVFVPAED